VGDSKAFTVKTLGGRGTDYVTHTCWGRQLAGEQTAPGSCRDRVVRSPRGYTTRRISRVHQSLEPRLAFAMQG